MRKTDHEGLARNLKNQIDAIMRQTNHSGIKTRYRYRDGCYRFCNWLAVNYRLQKFSNVGEKHILAYIKYLKERGYAASYITTELSAIRYFYNYSGGKNKLPSNNELNLEKRIEGNVERAWTENEFNRAYQIALQMGREDVVKTILLMRHFGLRIEGAVTLTTKQLESAFEFNELIVKEKGGLVRSIPIEKEIQRNILCDLLKDGPKGGKIFIKRGDSTHKIKQGIQKWIYNNRKYFQDDDRKGKQEIIESKKLAIIEKSNLSAHGLRHKYAQIRMDDLLNEQLSEEQAKQLVSNELGHHRKSVTSIYLAKKNTY